jgi:hypothetical protein
MPNFLKLIFLYIYIYIYIYIYKVQQYDNIIFCFNKHALVVLQNTILNNKSAKGRIKEG